MSRFTDIELTSQAADGSWTWRAAGARQPRGTVPSDLVPSGGRVGEIVRAELESGLDGVEVISIVAPKAQRRAGEGIQRIEVLGGARDPSQVSSSRSPAGPDRATVTIVPVIGSARVARGPVVRGPSRASRRAHRDQRAGSPPGRRGSPPTR